MKPSIWILFVLPMAFGLAAWAGEDECILMDHAFDGLRTGILMGAVGAHAEYHYLPECAPYGPWSVSAYTSEDAAQRAWRVAREGGNNILLQTYTNAKNKESHPLVIAGSPSWRDYCLAVRFARDANQGRCGVVFRRHNDRCCCFFGLENNKVALILIHDGLGFRQPAEKVLAEASLTPATGAYLDLRVSVCGASIRGEISGASALTVEDATFPEGNIGLLSDVPARFASVKVTASKNACADLDARSRAQARELEDLQAANPRPVLWKKFSTDGFGAGRNVRFGDLDGDGQIDVLIGQVHHWGPKDRNTELSCLTAVTLDGKRLWQRGEPDSWKTMLTSDVAFQIHDIDGDGRNEVVYCMNQEIIVADGATGETKYKAPTPETPPDTEAPYNKFPRILGDSLCFCDLRGTGRAADILLKDRYQHVWALDDHLHELWHARCNTGHYPFAKDINGDGKDEIAIGYSLFGHDGKPLWSLDDQLKDHADGVSIVNLEQNQATELRVVYAASDEGFFLTDLRGNILKHLYLGHIQNPAIADFRADLPGLETVTVNFWGSQGIIHFYDAHGDVYHDFEPFQHGSMCLPVNWTGAPPEYVMLSANAEDGGLFDGWGRRVVRLPADGHPDMCYAVLDVTGDCRDDIIVWDPYEIWIYTQDDNPKPGRLYKPVRNPLYNYSNYQATVSLPGWNVPETATKP